jgi:DNA primase large subunit
MGFRKELKRVFTEVYSYDEASTADFYIALDEWDATRVSASLGEAIVMVEKVPMAWKHNEVRGPFMECLAEPSLLVRERVMTMWKELFLRLERIPTGVGDKWMPGAMVLLFDSDLRVKALGEQMFKKRDRKIGYSEFEFNLHKPLLELIERISEKVYLLLSLLISGQFPRL